MQASNWGSRTLAIRTDIVYGLGMPSILSSDVAAAREHNRVIDVLHVQRDSKRSYTDVTLTSDCMAGDRTKNGKTKKKRSSDRISKHVPNVAYVLSDTVVSDMHTGKVVAIKKTTSRIVQRNADGTVNDALTLAVASAVNHKRGTIKRGSNA